MKKVSRICNVIICWIDKFKIGYFILKAISPEKFGRIFKPVIMFNWENKFKLKTGKHFFYIKKIKIRNVHRQKRNNVKIKVSFKH